MKTISRLLAVLLVGALALPAFAADAKNAAVVNGKAISQAKIDLIVKAVTAQGQQKDSPELRQNIKENLVLQELVTQEAAKKNLDKTAEAEAMLDSAKAEVYRRLFMQDFLKNSKVADADIKAEYDKFKNGQPSKEYKARHILVKDEKLAKDLLPQLNKGAKFDKLAEKHSEDPGSKAKGGDLDWNVPSTFVGPFGDALAKLEKGQMTKEPVKTEYGYHIIKLEDVRATKPVPSLEEMKPQLTQFLQQQQLQKTFAELKAKAKIE